MALQGSDIAFRYGPRFQLAGASLRAEAGALVGVIGANGSGKTTLLKILCGLLPRDGGTILLDGKPIESYSASARARHIAFVPQSYTPTFPFTVEQMVILGRMPYRSGFGGFETEQDVAAADRAIALMDLESLRHEPVTRLSGGELQRVLVAKALCQQTGTLLLDEPSAHLDISHMGSVFETIRHEAQRSGTAVIASIHDLNLASAYSDSIVVVAEGRVLVQGAPSEVLRAEILRTAFGLDLDIQPNVYGDAPSVRIRYHRERIGDA